MNKLIATPLLTVISIVALGTAAHASDFLIDNNGDGYYEGFGIDSWNDGIADIEAFDTNYDGYWDVVLVDQDNDGWLELVQFDTNYDGVYDIVDTDYNRNGILDSLEATVQTTSIGTESPDIANTVIDEIGVFTSLTMLSNAPVPTPIGL